MFNEYLTLCNQYNEENYNEVYSMMLSLLDEVNFYKLTRDFNFTKEDYEKIYSKIITIVKNISEKEELGQDNLDHFRKKMSDFFSGNFTFSASNYAPIFVVNEETSTGDLFYLPFYFANRNTLLDMENKVEHNAFGAETSIFAATDLFNNLFFETKFFVLNISSLTS